MRKNVVTAPEETSLYKISKKLSNNKVGSVVITKSKQVVGIVTERDIVEAVASKKNLEKLKARDLKKKKIVTAAPSEDLLEVTRKMVKEGVKRLPVLDKGKLIGIITDKEVLTTAPELIEILSEKLKARIDNVAETDEKISGICEECGNYSDRLTHEEGKWYCEDCA